MPPATADEQLPAREPEPDSDGGCGNCLCHGALRSTAQSSDLVAAALVIPAFTLDLVLAGVQFAASEPTEDPPPLSGRDISLAHRNLRR